MGLRLSPSSPENQHFLEAPSFGWSILLSVATASILIFLWPAAPVAVVIPVGVVLGVPLLIPWGLKEQGLLCGVVALSYSIATYSDLTSQVAASYLYAYLGLGTGILVSLLGASWQQSRRARLSRQATEFQQNMLEVEILQELNRSLASILDWTQLLPSLTQAAQRLCQPQGLAVGLLIPEEQEIEIYTQTDPALHQRRVPVEEVFARKILQVGWPIYIEELSTPPFPAQLLQVWSSLGYTSLLVVPLRAAHRIIGVLLAGWHTRRVSLPRREEELFQLLADQTAQALTNVRLYEEQERHLRTSEALRRVGQSISATLNRQEVLKLVVEEAARLLSCEAATLTLCVPDSEEVEVAGAYGFASQWTGFRVPLAESLTGVVIQKRCAVRQTEVPGQNWPLMRRFREARGITPRSFLAVPLWQEEKPMGALAVLTASARTFSFKDESILQALADQAVHAITNAQLYTQLQEALRRAQDANRQKSMFFANASHELRTPIHIIMGYLDLVREGTIGHIDPTAAETLGRVTKTAHHLLTLVNDLLDLSRIERADLPLHWEPVNLEGLLDEACSQWTQATKNKGLVLRREGDAPLPTITTDKARLRQILDNLMANALKFTQEGHIALGASVHDHFLKVWVQDTGIGIDLADQERIFDEFQQLEQGTDQRRAGFGLGLAVCKKLTHLLGGEIRVESTVGQGSTFIVTLPWSTVQEGKEESQPRQA